MAISQIDLYSCTRRVFVTEALLTSVTFFCVYVIHNIVTIWPQQRKKSAHAGFCVIFGLLYYFVQCR